MNIALTEKSTAYLLFQRASAVGCKREQKLLRERAFVSEGRPRLGLRQSLSEKSEWNREFNDLLRKRGGFYCDLEELSLHLLEDIRAYKRNDPAARSAIEVVLLYNGLHATIDYRIAHWFYRHRCFFIARAISQWSKMWTGIEIHPGAQIGRRLVIDHGAGIVIGETTQIGDDCLLYQGVTLGGTGKDVGKRHPTLGNNVMVGSGAKVLGPFRVGDNARIAANAVVLREVPPGATVVGVPGRIVRLCGDKLDHIHTPDPVMLEIEELKRRMALLEEQINDTKKET